MTEPFGALLGARTLGVIAVLAFALLWLAPPARSQVVQPVVQLGPVVVAGNLATVNGTLGGAPLATIRLTINGQPVFVNADGRFSAVVDLTGASVITLVVRTTLTGTVLLQIGIPVSLVGSGGAISDVLAVLVRAGVSLRIPPEGIRIFDGRPVTITGNVVNRSELTRMTINGIDVLGLLMPDGSFTLRLPGSTREIRVDVTDLQRVTETRIVEVVHYVTVPGSPAGAPTDTPAGTPTDTPAGTPAGTPTGTPPPTVLRCTIVGTAGADRLSGTPGNDVICALGGNDRVVAGAGRDTVSGGSGRDSLFGQVGRDRILGGLGADRIRGGRGSDQLSGAGGRDLLSGGTHADGLVGGAGNDRLSGGRGADRMLGSAGRDTLLARDRTRDVVLGGAGRDRARTDRIDRRRSIERRF